MKPSDSTLRYTARCDNQFFMQPQRLVVPLFQRPYVWNEQIQWERALHWEQASGHRPRAPRSTRRPKRPTSPGVEAPPRRLQMPSRLS